MRPFLAALAACSLLPAAAADFGFAESVRGVPHSGYPPALAEVFEHVINPEDERLEIEAQQAQFFSTQRSSP